MVIGDTSKVPAECGEIPFSYHKIMIGRALMTHTALSLSHNINKRNFSASARLCQAQGRIQGCSADGVEM